MHEELMKRLEVPRRELPTLELLRDGTVSARFRPYGLWIIGVNGRVDLVKGQELFFIHDHAKTFEAPNWHVAPATARRESKPFDDVQLKALLST